MDSKAEEFLKIEVFTKYFHHIREDEAPEVVGSVLECLKDVVETFGPSSIDSAMEEICEVAILLLKGEAFC